MTTQLKKRKESSSIIEELPIAGYEKVVKITNTNTKLNAIIAIHNTSLGPALGGTRIYPYKDFNDALKDVLRLSKGMTYKSAVAGIGFGGGKSVIMADSKDKTEEMLLSFAEAVNSLEGKYFCAEDVGCSTKDVMTIRKKTPYVVGLCNEQGSGDPARFTAWGIFRGIQSALQKIYGSDLLEGKKVAIQGIGSVGLHLLDLLFWHGADLVISDIDKEKLDIVAKKYGIKAIHHSEIFKEECDILAPCALGGVINDDTIVKLRCKAIAGCANNQLLREEHGDILQEKGILYAPDFVINAGGAINVSFEHEKEGYHPKKPREQTNNIYNVLMTIYEIAEKNKISTDKAAAELAEYRIKYGIGRRTNPRYFH